MGVIGISIFVITFLIIGSDKIIQTFTEISPIILLLVLLLTLPKLLLHTLAWQKLLKIQKIKINYLKALKYNLIGNFYGILTQGYSGEYLKILYMRDEIKEPYGKLFVNSTIKRALKSFSSYFIVLICAIFVIPVYPQIFAGIFLYVTLATTFYWIFIKPERGKKILNFLNKYLIPKKIKKQIMGFTGSFYKDFPKIKDLIKPFLICAFVEIIIITQLYILAVALSIQIPLYIIVVLHFAAGIIALIPISFSGIGIREGVLVLLYSLYGIAPEKAMVMSISINILSKLFTGLLSSFVLAIDAQQTRIRLTKIKSISAKQQ
jgi:uncharacterized protein (TIRG00374 family)